MRLGYINCMTTLAIHGNFVHRKIAEISRLCGSHLAYQKLYFTKNFPLTKFKRVLLKKRKLKETRETKNIHVELIISMTSRDARPNWVLCPIGLVLIKSVRLLIISAYYGKLDLLITRIISTAFCLAVHKCNHSYFSVYFLVPLCPSV